MSVWVCDSASWAQVYWGASSLDCLPSCFPHPNQVGWVGVRSDRGGLEDVVTAVTSEDNR